MIFRIHLKKGDKAIPIFDYDEKYPSRENEVLLPSGTKFYIGKERTFKVKNRENKVVDKISIIDAEVKT
ncbi:ADP-ribosyltransferase [Candidatus Pacearchaeota archaeon]|jgi:hypothetical protein|nr:ADP-ribosyltransferase [Candidatus Pacearchaeota archaeon]